MNASLKELQKTLLGRVQALSLQLDGAKTAKEADAIVREMQEFNHRVTLTGQLLFREQSEELERKVAKVTAAKADVDKAIRTIASARRGVLTLTKFLHLVDEAIDLAKGLKAL